MYERRDVFQAIADPVRREIIGLIAQQSLTMNSVAENFDISRPAISKHMKILEECGLVTINKKGRERICEAKLDSLDEVSNWVTFHKKMWTQRFDDLDNYLKEIQTKKK